MPTTLAPNRSVFNNGADATDAFWAEPLAVTVDSATRVVDITKDHTVIESGLMLNIDGTYTLYKGRGTASLNKGDLYDAEVGVRLALARSLESIASRLTRQAEGIMTGNENTLADQARRKEINRQKSEVGRRKAADQLREEEQWIEDVTTGRFSSPEATADAIIDGIIDGVSDAETKAVIGALFGRD